MTDNVRSQIRIPKDLKVWGQAYARRRGSNFSKLIVQLLTDLRDEELRRQAPQEAEQI